MNRHVNAIAGRMSLRPPQRDSLEILDRITEIVPFTQSPDVAAALAAVVAKAIKLVELGAFRGFATALPMPVVDLNASNTRARVY
jgi:hypothetical protein